MREIDIVDEEQTEYTESEEDIYTLELRENLLEEDEINEQEDAFMRGYGSA